MEDVLKSETPELRRRRELQTKKELKQKQKQVRSELRKEGSLRSWIKGKNTSNQSETRKATTQSVGKEEEEE